MTSGFPKALALFACAGFLGFALWQIKLLEAQTGTAAPKNGPGTSVASSSFPAGQRLRIRSAAEAVPEAPRSAQPAFQWHALETEDYRQYLENLQSIGCPKQTVRDIVATDLLSAYSGQRNEALTERFRDFKYWRADAGDGAARRELERKRRLVDQEMSWAMRELLGEDFLPPSTSQAWRLAELDSQLAFLPDNKRTTTRNLLVEYAETDQQVKALASGQYLTEEVADRQQIMEAYDRKRAALQALLSPAEFRMVEMTASWTADNLRRGLTKFNPTETEFQVLFQEWQEYDETLARMHAAGQPDPGGLDQTMREVLRARLGEQRAGQFWETWWK